MQSPRTVERSRDDRVVFGVCGGVGRALDLDPTIVRVVTVVLVALGGIGLLAYVVAALLLPEEGGRGPIIDLGFDTGRTGTIAGLIVLAAVVVLLVGPLRVNEPGTLAVVLAIGVAGWLLLRDRRQADDAARPAAGQATTTAMAMPAPPAPVAHPTPARPAGTRPSLAAGGGGDGGEGGDDDAHRDDEPARGAPVPRRRARVTAIGWGITLLALAVGAAVFQGSSENPSWPLFAGIAVIVVGGVLLLTAPFGGTGGLVLCGFLLATAVGISNVSDVSLRGGAGERVYRPSVAAELREEYRLGAGSMTLDLSRLDLPPGTTTVEADVGVGELLIDVPPDADVTVDGSAGAGEIVLFGETHDGVGPDATRVVEGAGTSRLVIDAHVGFGNIDVERGTR